MEILMAFFVVEMTVALKDNWTAFLSVELWEIFEVALKVALKEICSVESTGEEMEYRWVAELENSSVDGLADKIDKIK